MNKYLRVLFVLIVTILSASGVITLVALAQIIFFDKEAVPQTSLAPQLNPVIDYQSSYPECCTQIIKEGDQIIEIVNGVRRVLFINAGGVKNVYLGPDYQTLHFEIEEPSSITGPVFLINVKERLTPATPENIKLIRGEIPSQSPPWDFSIILKNNYEILPQKQDINSIIYVDNIPYIIYVNELNKTKYLRAFNLQTRNSSNIETFEYTGEQKGWEEPIKFKFQDGYISYPPYIDELKSYYLFEYGPQLITLSKDFTAITHNINLPALGEDSPTCGNRGLEHESFIDSDVIVFGQNKCQGVMLSSILDLSAPMQHHQVPVTLFYNGYSEYNIEPNAVGLKLTQHEFEDRFDEVISFEELQCGLGIDETPILERAEKALEAKYPKAGEVSCLSPCDVYGGCFVAKEDVIYQYNTTTKKVTEVKK